MQTEPSRFELKAEHLKLLKCAVVRWQDDEFGAPEIDPKRPYGNSYVEGDIAELLGVEPAGAPDPWGNPDYTPEQTEMLRRIHRETQGALAVILTAQTFELGWYECDPYDFRWRKAVGGK